MRGKAHGSGWRWVITRITPAYAGKSKRRSEKVCKAADHPRLCGEKAVQRGDITGMSGSPPPMRGKELTHATLQTPYGITPAYAGKSFPALYFCM